MTRQDPNSVRIDSVHSGAICTAIGEGLRTALTVNPNQLPPHILGLTQRFDCVEPTEIDSR
jgi:hypothetical protein